jgi:hypothetical protein
MTMPMTMKIATDDDDGAESITFADQDRDEDADDEILQRRMLDLC